MWKSQKNMFVKSIANVRVTKQLFLDVLQKTNTCVRVSCNFINTIQDGRFSGLLTGGGGGKRPSSLKSVAHILQWWNLTQLYLTWRRSKKIINHATHPVSSADISIFSLEISNFLLYDVWYNFCYMSMMSPTKFNQVTQVIF